MINIGGVGCFSKSSPMLFCPCTFINERHFKILGPYMRRNRFNIKITHALSYLNGKSCKCGVDK
jgi:hypothetical protein